jgi:hypothetical protein
VRLGLSPFRLGRPSDAAGDTPRTGGSAQHGPEPEPEVDSRAQQLPAERAWNVWKLERLARAGTPTSAVLDEERCYLLIYLRQFASADGMLPVQFDPLVREAFAELLGTLPA